MLGMSQEKLAKLFGVLRPAISLIDNGDRKVGAEELRKLAEIFNTSCDSLLNPQKKPQVVVRETRSA